MKKSTRPLHRGRPRWYVWVPVALLASGLLALAGRLLLGVLVLD